MLVKYLCVAVSVGYVCGGSLVYSKGGNSPLPKYPSPFYELPCMASGGICLQKHECPEGKQAASGLCPIQEEQGIECCYSVAKSTTSCRSRGGECMNSQCGPGLMYSGATDCDYDEKCCILVH